MMKAKWDVDSYAANLAGIEWTRRNVTDISLELKKTLDETSYHLTMEFNLKLSRTNDLKELILDFREKISEHLSKMSQWK